MTPSLSLLRHASARISVVCVLSFLVLLTISGVDVATAQEDAGSCSTFANSTECCADSICRWGQCENQIHDSCMNSSQLPGTNCTNNCTVPNTTHTATTVVTTAHTATTRTATTEVTMAHTATTHTTGTTESSTHLTHPTATATTPLSTGTSTHLITSITNITTTGIPYTVTTHNNTTTARPFSCQGFDGASFVGGIVLGLGVTLIAVFIYKFVVSRRNGPAPYQQF